MSEPNHLAVSSVALIANTSAHDSRGEDANPEPSVFDKQKPLAFAPTRQRSQRRHLSPARAQRRPFAGHRTYLFENKELPHRSRNRVFYNAVFPVPGMPHRVLPDGRLAVMRDASPRE